MLDILMLQKTSLWNRIKDKDDPVVSMNLQQKVYFLEMFVPFIEDWFQCNVNRRKPRKNL